MARVLIVGCGCRGRALAAELVAGGHTVRGTTRDPARRPDISDSGAEPWLGDPQRLETLTRALESVTIVCWLLASAEGEAEQLSALHDQRLAAYLRELVDTTVRGFVYEAAGTVGPACLRRGREIVAAAAATWEIPVALVEADPSAPREWSAAARGAVEQLLR